MTGIARLHSAGIAFHTIAVLTRDALAEPDAVYDFFATLGTAEAGFNVEEVEGAHVCSSLQEHDAEAAARRFWRRMLERMSAEQGRLRVREVAMVLAALRDPRFGRYEGNSQNLPGRLLSVACDGGFSFWSPELLGAAHPVRGRAVLGHLGDGSFDWSAASGPDGWRGWQAEIDAGVRRCREICRYFPLCLGGAPSNKLAEYATMDAAETMACRLGQQAVIDEVLRMLEQQLGPLA